jgi:hypothetical protein
MRKNVRGIGREPNHMERGVSPKMAKPSAPGSFGSARQGTGLQPGAGELPKAHHGPGDAALRKIRTSGGG